MAARTWILRLHMVSGLALSAYAIAIGISGSALVFRDQIKAAEYPQFHHVAPIPISTTPDQAVTGVRAAYPGARPLTVTWPNQDSPYWMTYVLLQRGAREVFTDPSTGTIVGDRDPSGGWNGWLARLHTNLLGGSTGRRINGYGAWLLILMSATGTVLWWPRGGANISRTFRLSWEKGWRTVTWQLHHIFGFVALPFIFVVSVTGTYFMWSTDYVKLVSSVFERTSEPKPDAATGDLLRLDQLAKRAYAALPGREIQRLQVVDAANQAVRVTMREGTPAEFHLVSTVFLHPVTGEVLRIDPLATRPAGDGILAWFSALHFGNFGGWPMRIAWALLGLSLPVLSITGCLMWWRRIVEPLWLPRRSLVGRGPSRPNPD